MDESDTIPLRQAGGVSIASVLSPTENEDPLGIDARRLVQRHLKFSMLDSLFVCREKYTVNPDLYPEGAHGILKFEGFDPAWYILENYQKAS